MSSAIDLGPVIALLSFDTATVTRNTVTYNGNGVAVPGAPSTFSLPCNEQPVTGKDLLRLHEGQRSNGVLTLFSQAELRFAKMGQLADSVVFRGDAYTVVHSEQWDAVGYWRSVLVKAQV